MAEQSSRVFVGGFKSSELSEDELRNRFQDYGPITDITAMVRGFCFVQFENPDDAKMAVDHESETFFFNGKKLTVQLAKSSAKKKEKTPEPAQDPWFYNPTSNTSQPQRNDNYGQSNVMQSHSTKNYAQEPSHREPDRGGEDYNFSGLPAQFGKSTEDFSSGLPTQFGKSTEDFGSGLPTQFGKSMGDFDLPVQFGKTADKGRKPPDSSSKPAGNRAERGRSDRGRSDRGRPDRGRQDRGRQDRGGNRSDRGRNANARSRSPKKPSNQFGSRAESNNCKVFVSGPAKLKFLKNEDAVYDLFARFGEIKEVAHGDKNFSFVIYANREDAETAVNDRSIKQYRGQRLAVEFAKTSDSGPARRERTPPRRERTPPRIDPWGSRQKSDQGSRPGRLPEPNRGRSPRRDTIWDQPEKRKPVTPPRPTSPPPDVNHCEIVVADMILKDYAEKIESRLKEKRLQVDLLFPHSSVSVDAILDDLNSRGVRYGLVVGSLLNESHNTVNLCMLHLGKKYYRNIPVEEAISLITVDFNAFLLQKAGKSGTRAPIISSRPPHPEDIQLILSFLEENRSISIGEYDRILEYFTEKREALAKKLSVPRRTESLLAAVKEPEATVASVPFKSELGLAEKEPSRQAALESRIKNILTSSSAGGSGKEAMFEAQKSFIHNFLKNREGGARMEVE